MAPAMGIDLPAGQKARLDDVAARLLAIYETLAHMRCILPEQIHRGPHTIDDELQEVYDNLKLDPSVVYLYSILPYVVTESDDATFFKGSSFADFRTEHDVQQGRDPLYCSPSDPEYSDRDGPYMFPWFTPLAMLGSDDIAILYDTRGNCIWILDEANGCSADPGQDGLVRGREDDDEDDEDEDDDDDDDDDSDDENGHTGENKNDIREIDSRPAPDVLGDILGIFRRLEEIPGCDKPVIGTEWNLPEEMSIPQLYRRHGWPDTYADEESFQQKLQSFDGDAFEADLTRWKLMDDECFDASKLQKDFDLWKGSSVEGMSDQEQWFLDRAERLGRETEEGWKWRLAAFIEHQRQERGATNFIFAKKAMEEACPTGSCIPPASELPLWELKAVEDATASLEEDVKVLAEEPAPERGSRTKATAEHELRIHLIALARSKEVVNRQCPGRSTDEVRDILAHRSRVRAKADREIRTAKRDAALRDKIELGAWAAGIPEAFPTIRSNAEDEIKSLQQQFDAQDGYIRLHLDGDSGVAN